MGERRVTMRDVAKASGVSPATVSFVLNNVTEQHISPATRDRVTTAARELGYVPHAIAKALREGTSRIVLLALPAGIRGPGLDAYTRGLDDELARHGHVLLVRHGSSLHGTLASVIATVSPRAVIDLSGLYREAADGPAAEPVTSNDGGWIDGLAAHTLVQLRHLTRAGHTSIAVALPPDDSGWARLARVRLHFAREAAARIGLAEPPTLTIPEDAAEAARAVRDFRREFPSVSAVAAFDDAVAMHLLSVLHGLDVAVPGQLAVIGFDAVEYGSFATPALTSVHIDAQSYGQRAARTVLGLEPPSEPPAPATVIVRESV
ncbi:LacI family DNA-binding transcriptional regulator [Promicromonospora soli]|uniref:LacI family transcriptional regulator n=1 Tax=Promicromonospora soli TaxID=2035533 RepID=A0A919FP75_9MICO|nr:LacI family DNA-binding transcriptional regulator [Promicromonospora soli]GHH69466.1 LacI family transcriptional regulator [Promicromonospora soli]